MFSFFPVVSLTSSGHRNLPMTFTAIWKYIRVRSASTVELRAFNHTRGWMTHSYMSTKLSCERRRNGVWLKKGEGHGFVGRQPPAVWETEQTGNNRRVWARPTSWSPGLSPVDTRYTLDTRKPDDRALSPFYSSGQQWSWKWWGFDKCRWHTFLIQEQPASCSFHAVSKCKWVAFFFLVSDLFGNERSAKTKHTLQG